MTRQIPEHQLHIIARPIEKTEHVPAQRICLHHTTDHAAQPGKRLAHIHRLLAYINPHPRTRSKHRLHSYPQNQSVRKSQLHPELPPGIACGTSTNDFLPCRSSCPAFSQRPSVDNAMFCRLQKSSRFSPLLLNSSSSFCLCSSLNSRDVRRIVVIPVLRT